MPVLEKRYLYTFNFESRNNYEGLEVDYDTAKRAIIQDDDWIPIEDYGDYLLLQEKIEYNKAFVEYLECLEDK